MLQARDRMDGSMVMKGMIAITTDTGITIDIDMFRGLMDLTIIDTDIFPEDILTIGTVIETGDTVVGNTPPP